MNQPPTALVLAAHGAASPQALGGVVNVYELARRRFAGAEVRLCFTSALVRGLLRKRAPGSPHAQTRGALATLADLQEQGFRDIVVQPLFIFAGAEYLDLAEIVRGLAQTGAVDPAHKPFRRLALGRPALGKPGPEHPYMKDIHRAAAALEGDALRARESGAALVCVGHGNRRFSTGVYQELQEVLRRRHPELICHVGCLDGVHGLARTRRRLARSAAEAGVEKALLLPLLLAAGSHIYEDICGSGPGSWATALAADGLAVQCLKRGLGEVDAWAGLYLDHAVDAAAETGIGL